MINLRAVSLGANFAVPMDLPCLEPHDQAQELGECLVPKAIYHHME